VGGITVVLFGDFQQNLGGIPRGKRADEFQAFIIAAFTRSKV
jgi:hypothetical protein